MSWRRERHITCKWLNEMKVTFDTLKGEEKKKRREAQHTTSC